MRSTGEPHGEARRAEGLSVSEQLNALLTSWRERLDPGSLPGLRMGSRIRATTGKVSQEQMARLVGASTRWYAKLERGETANYSDDMLDRTAAALRLSPGERTVLFLLAGGREPPLDERPTAATDVAAIKQIVHAQPWPAYVSTATWDVVLANKHVPRWFPHLLHERAQHNVMLWPFSHPDVRTQLVEWENAWARPALAQLRAASARHPDNTRLEEIIKAILSVDKDARRIWKTHPEVDLHPDGNRRRLHLPDQNHPQTVEIVAMAPLRAADGLRVVMVIPIDR